MADLAPVIAFDQAKRAILCRRLHALGITVDQMRHTHTQDGDQGLADLWTRERTLASLTRLTGNGRWMLERHTTDELVEIERRVLAQLMGSDGRSADALIYPIARRLPLAAQGIPA